MCSVFKKDNWNLDDPAPIQLPLPHFLEGRVEITPFKAPTAINWCFTHTIVLWDLMAIQQLLVYNQTHQQSDLMSAAPTHINTCSSPLLPLPELINNVLLAHRIWCNIKFDPIIAKKFARLWSNPVIHKYCVELPMGSPHLKLKILEGGIPWIWPCWA